MSGCHTAAHQGINSFGSCHLMHKRQSIPEAHQQYYPVRVKNKALTFTFFPQHHHCPDADERCTVTVVDQLNSLPRSTQMRTDSVVFICRYVILFRSHLSFAPRSSYSLPCNVFLSAQCQTGRRQFIRVTWTYTTTTSDDSIGDSAHWT
jgi:hypothetical protein